MLSYGDRRFGHCWAGVGEEESDKKKVAPWVCVRSAST